MEDQSSKHNQINKNEEKENKEQLDNRRRNSVQTEIKEPLNIPTKLIEENNKENSLPIQSLQSPNSILSRTILFEKFQKKFDESISKTQILIERTKSLTTHYNSSNNFSNKISIEKIENQPLQTPQFLSKKIIFPSSPPSFPTPSSFQSIPPPLSSDSSCSSPLPPPLPPTVSSHSFLLPPSPSSSFVPPPSFSSSTLPSHPPSILSSSSSSLLLCSSSRPSLLSPSFFFPSHSFIIPPSSSSPILRLCSKTGLTTIYYKNGQKYQGDVEGLNRHGFGLLYTTSGRILYQGEWENDKYEGHGILNNPEWTVKEIGGGEEIGGGIGARREKERAGERAAERLGGGELEEKTGGEWLKYEGEFKNGKADGKGILLFSNKEYLDGKFSEGKVNGLCWLSMKSGERLFGEWKDNVFIRNLC